MSNESGESWVPSEELMWGKAECSHCAVIVKTDARTWAHRHVQETGHDVMLTLGYDVRDEHWESRLPYERLVEIDRLRQGLIDPDDAP